MSVLIICFFFFFVTLTSGYSLTTLYCCSEMSLDLFLSNTLSQALHYD
jgi:hypothetical protein